MSTTFYKYQGTGNDFVMIDNRSLQFDKNDTKYIKSLCDRRFGIGADGLILLENDLDSDFKMVYYNADGRQSSMCGNGGRCLVAFAKFLGIIKNTTEFIAIDGLHKAEINDGIVKLQMQNVGNIEHYDTHTFLNTGSPHHVQIVSDIATYNVKTNGAKIRYGDPYGKVGSNVNFVEPLNDSKFKVRTYERGVEDETYSCGTGVTAVAIAMHATKKTHAESINITTPGGDLKVTFNRTEEGYHNIWLIGPAVQVFKGVIE